MTVICSNPTSVHAPLGLYSHTASVSADTELLFISGQLGVRPDGSTPATIAEQADQVFANIIALLNAQGLDASSIVKLTTFMVAGHDGDAVRAARLKHLGSHRPASTGERSSPPVERWRQSHEPSRTDRSAAAAGSREPARRAPEAGDLYVNRRVRNRTHGGVVAGDG